MQMKRFRRALSAILAAVMVYSVLGSSLFGVFAAVTPVSLTVDKFENGTLTFHWTKPSGTGAAVVTYHKPDPDSTTDAAILVVSAPVVTGSSISISGLEPDTVYDIGVTLYGSVNGSGNPSGNPTGRGLMFYLPSMTFHSAAGGQTYASIAGGGREIDGGIFLEYYSALSVSIYFQRIAFAYAQRPPYFLWYDDPAKLVYSSHYTCCFHVRPP
jgi:hypothetical protein